MGHCVGELGTTGTCRDCGCGCGCGRCGRCDSGGGAELACGGWPRALPLVGATAAGAWSWARAGFFCSSLLVLVAVSPSVSALLSGCSATGEL